MKSKQPSDKDNSSSNAIDINTPKQNLNNKKIYFNSDGTEIKIGYNDETGVGFVEIIDNN